MGRESRTMSTRSPHWGWQGRPCAGFPCRFRWSAAAASAVALAASSLSALGAILGGCGAQPNSPPELEPQDGRVAVVGEELAILLAATDADGDSLEYRYTTNGGSSLEGRARLFRTPGGSGVFRFTPIAADVGQWYFDFHVHDGLSGATITIPVEVRPAHTGGERPRFVRPLGTGTVLDLHTEDCLTLEVAVEVPAGAPVRITQAEPRIEGATLTEADEGRAEADERRADTREQRAMWQWCPTETQVATTRRYPLVLTADDGEHEPVRKDYLVLLHAPGDDEQEPGHETPMEEDPVDDEEEPGCVDDPHEDDDGLAMARTAFVVPTAFVSTRNRICPGDPDWYKVELFDGERLVVDLTFDQATPDEDLDLYFYGEDGTNLTPCCSEVGQSSTDDEHLSIRIDGADCVSESCSLYVVVEGYRGAANDYDITMALAP